METFTSLLLNLGLLSLSSVFVFIFVSRVKFSDTGHRHAILVGIVYGLVSVLVTSFPIFGPNGALFDTRAAPILLAGFFNGPVAGLIAATIGAIGRYQAGGPVVWGGVASFYFYLAAALAWRQYIGVRPLSPGQLAALGVIASVVVIPAFFMRSPFEDGWAVLLSFWHVLLIGNLVGTVLMGMIVSQIFLLTTKQQEHQAIIDSSADGIITINAKQVITTVNPAAEQMFGWTVQELRGRSIDTLVPHEVKSHHHAFASGFIKQKEIVTRQMTDYRIIRALRKDGSNFPALISLAKFVSVEQAMVVATVHDMTEIQTAKNSLERMTEALAERLNESVAANESKNLFLANMSHELRTPLNAIIGFSSLVEYMGVETIKPTRVNEYITDIRASGESLLAMINDVLDISKIESDKVDIEIRRNPVRTIIDKAVLLAKPALSARHMLLRSSGDIDASVNCDLRTITQAVLNLLTNAIKFSPTGSTVKIHIKGNSDSIQLSVEDDGIGIPDIIIERLGEPFLRGDTPETRAIAGTGLGLALSKKFIERQGGTLTMARKAEGGTIATITMPYSRGDAVADTQADNVPRHHSVCH